MRDFTHIPPVQTCEMTDFPQKGITRYQSEILVVPPNWCYLFCLSERVRGRRHSALVTPSACPAIRPEAGMPAAGRSRAADCHPRQINLPGPPILFCARRKSIPPGSAAGAASRCAGPCGQSASPHQPAQPFGQRQVCQRQEDRGQQIAIPGKLICRGPPSFFAPAGSQSRRAPPLVRRPAVRGPVCNLLHPISLPSHSARGRYASGRKIAGSRLPTLIFPWPRPSMLMAMPMMMVPPTALISVMTAGAR